MNFKSNYFSNKFLFVYGKYFLIIFFVQCKRPESKRLLATWRLECELGIITDPDCPIDGSWSPWTPWSNCHGACDNIGHRKRIRECNNPSPSKDGLPCSGYDEQIESCYPKNCSVQDYRLIVEGDTSRAEALRQLEVVPAFMERCLQMECPYEGVEAALATENIWQLNSETLWNALQCVKHDLGCSVNGEWGVWGSWSACGAQCGKGLRWRVRRCDTPPPSASHLVCLGSPLQSKECEGDQCAIDEQYLESISASGSWSQWGEWTKCSVQCGAGVRLRKRSCIEKKSLTSLTWATHCHGPCEELKICNTSKCLLNGGWSGWGTWGPCSKTCGAGKRSRTRSCTRPIPSGDGKNCLGPKIEVGSCHLSPCDGYSHAVAIFNGDSILRYDFAQIISTFFHFYIRFMPLSPHGTLLRRGSIQSPHLRVSLHKWHLCLDAYGSSKTCSLPRTCSPTALEPSEWQTALITVTSEAVTVRINDAQIPIQSTFPCDPELTRDKLSIFVGEKFHGEVQELIINFMLINISMERENKAKAGNIYPSLASNIAYENANIEEAYITLENEQYLRLPCFKVQDEWQLELTIKPKSESGIILFISNLEGNSWFYMTLQSMRLIIKYASDEIKSESTSSIECLPYQWLDIRLNKRKETSAIEVSINSGERLHVVLTEFKSEKQRRFQNENIKFLHHFSKNSSKNNNNQDNFKPDSNHTEQIQFCENEYFVGGLPLPLRNKIPEDLAPFSGIIASLKINDELLDLHNVNMERYKNEALQLSSRTASISGSYQEVMWDLSKKINLTCVHSRATRSPNPAYWLYLDTAIGNNNMCSTDDGRILRLQITTENSCPGFYTCRASDNESTRNFITFGILGRSRYKISGPDTLSVIAVCTTAMLVIFTFAWLMIEGYHDVRNGYGFFRDDQDSSDLVKDDNDQNENSLNFEKTFQITNAKARHRKRRLNVKAMLDAHEILGIREKKGDSYEHIERELDAALPEIENSILQHPHEIYRCEPLYANSNLQNSHITSLKTLLSSPSSNTSPRLLCTRLLMTKPKTTKRENKNILFPTVIKNSKSHSTVHNSPVQIVLKKFQNLKSSDL